VSDDYDTTGYANDNNRHNNVSEQYFTSMLHHQRWRIHTSADLHSSRFGYNSITPQGDSRLKPPASSLSPRYSAERPPTRRNKQSPHTTSGLCVRG
jgi:hypothetical protein